MSTSEDPSHALLAKLDGLLTGSTIEGVGYAAHGDHYSLQLDEIRKVCTAHREDVKQRVAQTAYDLLNKSMQTLRIFSIGCGDGSFDVKILQTITDYYPSLKIQYTGTDIDETSCQEAKKLLGALDNVEVEILVLDFEQMDPSKVTVPPCDLVLAVHIFYYMRDINKAVSVARSLRKPDGYTIIVSTASNSPNCELYKRFWLHEHKWPLKLSESIIKALEHLHISHETDIVTGSNNMTDSFNAGFEKPPHNYLLDFITHTKLERYPPAVAQTCINYLSSVAIGKPEQYKVPRVTAIIVCGKQERTNQLKLSI